MPYERGAHEAGDGLWAYLQPDGGWGWSNAGLVTDGGASLLVVNLTALGRDLGLDPPADVLTLFGGMAALAQR